MMPERTPKRALALPDRPPASGPAQKKATVSPAVFPQAKLPRTRLPQTKIRRAEQVLPRNITNLFEDWLHSRAAVHAGGIGVFGRNVDVEVKDRGAIPVHAAAGGRLKRNRRPIPLPAAPGAERVV